jgi:hypothetical protein
METNDLLWSSNGLFASTQTTLQCEKILSDWKKKAIMRSMTGFRAQSEE